MGAMPNRCFRTLLVLLAAALWGGACSSSPSTVPDAPSGLTAAAGDGEIVLSWDETDDGSITEYQFRERASFDDEWWCWTTFSSGSATISSRTLKGLPNGATYQIQLRALNGAGASAASEVSAALPASSSSPPEAPSGLAAAGGDQSIALSWDDPGDGSITEYQFREWFSETFGWHCWRRIYGSGASTTGHTMPDLTNGISYEVQLRAMSPAGSGRPAQTSARPTAPG